MIDVPDRLARYSILTEIGRGGFATVYEAQDTRLGRRVALKVIRGEFSLDPSFSKRFEQEAQAAASLHHPNIVTIYDYGYADGMSYLAMRLIRGMTLRQYLDEHRRLTLEQALPILHQLAEALDYLKDRRLVHRDLKPGNVMLEEKANSLAITLTDFGLVRSLERTVAITQSDGILGTPAYLAPEQVDAKQWGEITPLTDVYSLGVMAYEMLVGQLPFEGQLVALLRAHSDTPPPPPDLDDELSEVLLNALTKSPAQRFESAGIMVQALAEVADSKQHKGIQQLTLEDLVAQMHDAYEAGEWLRVQMLCLQIIHIERNHTDALRLMAEATQGLQHETDEALTRQWREKQYEDGVHLMAEGEWLLAAEAFAEVANSDPAFRDVQVKLAQAREELRLAGLYEKAMQAGQSGDLVEAGRAWIDIVRDRYDYREGEAVTQMLQVIAPIVTRYDEMIRLFRQQQRDLRYARETINRYRQILACCEGMGTAMDAGEWQQVVEMGETVASLMPTLSITRGLLEQAYKMLGWAHDRLTWRTDHKVMVRIPAAEFDFGQVHQRVLVPEFWIDRTLVTNAEYKRFIDANPSYDVPYTADKTLRPYNWDRKRRTYPAGKANYPVTLISWQDALAYAKWAGKRLPTEEEWELAARGMDGREYPWGNQPPSPERCNFFSRGPTPVATYSPEGDSPYGCTDMCGNVWEWTVSKMTGPGRVLRGGGWNSLPQQISATIPFYSTLVYAPDVHLNYVGIRCVVSMEELTGVR
ncbi:MAG: SUMF1/EgtB/PvdO family nonheme iron enzyme [Anaerolineae bacterium]|nr:SUMF1/EgtB/PvdO family nonheme iron enzyme [Anaerolineae bacterium]